MNLLSISQALGIPAPEARIPGVVENPFATGTFDYDAAALTTVIDFTDPTVWATDPVAAAELKVTGSEFDASLIIHSACVEFLDADALAILDPEKIRKVAEGLYFSVETGAREERYKVGFSVFGGKPASALDSDLATLTAAGWGYGEQYPKIGSIVNLRDIKSCSLVATAAATGSLLGANSAVRFKVRGALVSTSTAAPMDTFVADACNAKPLETIAVSRQNDTQYAVMQNMR